MTSLLLPEKRFVLASCIAGNTSPHPQVTDYRTAVSRVRPEDLKGFLQFKEVQAEVSELLKGRILVGHAIKHDFKVLFLDHPKKMIRDTSKYKPFRAAFGGRTPSLKNLSERFLGVAVQTGEHSSVQDSQVSQFSQELFSDQFVHYPGVVADRHT